MEAVLYEAEGEPRSAKQPACRAPPRSTPHPLHAVTPDVVGACSSVTLKKALYWKDVIIRQKPPLSPCAPELILWAWEIDFSVKTGS